MGRRSLFLYNGEKIVKYEEVLLAYSRVKGGIFHATGGENRGETERNLAKKSPRLQSALGIPRHTLKGGKLFIKKEREGRGGSNQKGG